MVDDGINLGCQTSASPSAYRCLSPKKQRGEAPQAPTIRAILREEDTFVSPPLLDQGGTVTRPHTLLRDRRFPFDYMWITMLRIAGKPPH